jgi:2-octaprenyl-6-methoxyphenol hydroxylase
LPTPASSRSRHHRHTRVTGFAQVTDRRTFPLRLEFARPRSRQEVVIGNAAQALHPIAGQGFNLGVRDA